MSTAALAHDVKAAPPVRSGLKPLPINRPGDMYEQEAERVSRDVVSGNGARPAWSLSKIGIAAPLQRECSCGGSCEDCKKKKKPEQMLQRDAAGGATSPMTAPPVVHDVLRGTGNPLDQTTRGFMESRFGHDFTSVRVFHDDAAAESARSVDANAYTVGNKIVFNQGRYAPDSHSGRQLLAHELAHVVQQQSGRATSGIQRQRCGHDGMPTKCGASNGVWTLIDKATDIATKYAIDDLIVEDGLKNIGGGGEWIRQVQGPPNPVKSADAIRGRIDGVKVLASSSLDAEIVEIKARSDEGGGCLKAMSEATGYVQELKLLAPMVASISQKLAAVGGLKVDGGTCKVPKAADKKMLEAAGVDFSNTSSVNAWCFYNSLQDRLGRMFTTPFSSVNIRANADGTAGKVYELPYGVSINCRKTKANPVGAGLRILQYMVNQKGGVSYGCRDICKKQDEEEKPKEKTTDVSDDVEDQKRFQNWDQNPQLDVPDAPQPGLPKHPPADPKQIGDPPRPNDVVTTVDDTGEHAPVQLPPSGITEVEALEITGGVVTTVAILHQALKVLKSPAEKAVVRELIEEKIEEGVAKGALDLARKLDSTNLAKYGTKEGDLLLKGADEAMVLAAKSSPRLAAKFAPTAFKTLTKAAPIIGLLLAANDARAAVSHIRKGGTIELGPSLDDVDLSGDTHVSAKGPQGDKKPSGDAKLTDTIIDVQTKTAPNVSGHVDIEADKVTIRGEAASEGSPVTVNVQVKMHNTTITFKSKGIVRDGKILAGDLDVSDSQIEIDLPPDALSGPRKPGEKKTITGAKIKVTSLSGGGGAGTGGTSGSGAGSQPTTTTPANPQSANPATANPQPANPTPANPQGGSGTGTPVPPVPVPPLVAGPDREALIKQIQKDENLRRMYTALTGKDGSLVTDESLRRFVDMKDMMKRHPEAVEKIISGLQPGSITDPIKDVIEPIEQTLAQENKKLEKELQQELVKKAAPKTPPGTAGSGSNTGTPATGDAKKQDKPTDPSNKPGDGTATPNKDGADKQDPDAKKQDKPADASDKTDDGTATPGKDGADKQDPDAKKDADPTTPPPTSSGAASVPFSGLQGQLSMPQYPVTDLGSGPPATYTFWATLSVTVRGVVLTYSLPLSLHTPKKLTPQQGETWRAEYTYEAPSGVFKSAEGDLPVQFSDAGKGSYPMTLMLTQPKK